MVALAETLVENFFQAVIAVDTVQACCVVGYWDMAEAILVDYESVGDRQSDRTKIGDVIHSEPVVKDIDWLHKKCMARYHHRNRSKAAGSHDEPRAMASDDLHWIWCWVLDSVLDSVRDSVRAWTWFSQ